MNTFNEKSPGNAGSGTSAPPAALGFWGNLGLIRPAGWIVALILFVGMQCVFWFAVWPNADPHEMAHMPFGLKVFLPFLPSTLLFIYVLLIGFIYVDAKRRGMRHVMWTWLAAVIPDAIGIILYFVMRDPMPTACPKCGKLSAQSFTFCPHCGSELMRTCRVCHKKLGQGWSNCAYCGTPVTGHAGSSAPPAVA